MDGFKGIIEPASGSGLPINQQKKARLGRPCIIIEISSAGLLQHPCER